MRPQTRVFVTFGVLVVLVVGLYAFTDWFSRATGYALGEDEQLKLVSCMNGNQAVLYTQADCAPCYRQEQVFASLAYEQLVRVDCSKTSCANLRELPAWAFGNNVTYGVLNFTQLSQLSDCPLTEQ